MKNITIELAALTLLFFGTLLAMPANANTDGAAASSNTTNAGTTSPNLRLPPSQEVQIKIWKKLVALVSEHNGSVDPHEFEQTFGVKFTKLKDEVLKHGAVVKETYMIRPNPSWPLQTNLQIFKKTGALIGQATSGLEVFFRDKYSVPDTAAPCLQIAQIFDDLRKYGWTTSGPFVPGTTVLFGSMTATATNPKSDYIVLAVTDPTRCLDSISISSRD
jgi:hypothetical protein